MAKILIVDDDPEFYQVVSPILRAEGHETARAEDPIQFASLLESVTPDLIVLDILLPAGGAQAAHRVLENNVRFCNIPILFCSGNAPAQLPWQPPSRPNHAFLPKPLDMEKFKSTVKQLLKLP